MFEPAPGPRVFAVPPGADFPHAVADGVLARTAGQPPEALARITIYLNTRRMERRLHAILTESGARLLPRLRLVTEIGRDLAMPGLRPPPPPLRRRLELAQLVARLIERDPSLAPRAAIYDLADSLAALIDEMQGEGVDPAAIRNLGVTDLSGHWERSLTFLGIVQDYIDGSPGMASGPEAHQRALVEEQRRRWGETPPVHPVILAGSTGSRGTTALLMQAVAGLPQGAVILPGFDRDLPDAIWASLSGTEDHPQARFARLLDMLKIGPRDVTDWGCGAAPSPARNRLVSLALRPAPVTDQWLSDGPALTDLPASVADMTLAEAPTPRIEALTISLRLRRAVEDGVTAALITPDRVLTRQVTAALDRWGIEPDDSAGRPLDLSAPGRFLRHIASLIGRAMGSEQLLELLKHPLAHSGAADRGPHLIRTRELELFLRRAAAPHPHVGLLDHWAGEDPVRQEWAGWVSALTGGLDRIGVRPLSDHVQTLRQRAEMLAAGPEGSGSGALWEKAAGEAALAAMEELATEAGHGGAMAPADFAALLDAILRGGEVRDPMRPHPQVMIWGTLEARVQGADLVILGGLNDGTWPDLPPPDPWLNRRMRAEAGMLLPDRRIGLAGHDFQQAIAAREVLLTRSLRDDEAETVPSRWLNRLTNLMAGLSGNGGPEALSAMRDRGADWIDHAQALDRDFVTVSAENRPSPRPPVVDRPRQLSVTRIQTLIRDPYAIYAREVLRLKPLEPLRPEPDAALRGTILHRVLERFVAEGVAADRGLARTRLMEVADLCLDEAVPWPVDRKLWKARLARAADRFLDGEDQRQAEGTPYPNERRGAFRLSGLDFTLTGTADRIDLLHNGRLAIYDYKTGSPPTRDQVRHFDKQLLLEAVMAEAGAFVDVPPATVEKIAYIGLGTTPKVESIPLAQTDTDDFRTETILDELRRLLAAYGARSRGYTARRAMMRMRFEGDYDHLARFGEWDDSDPAMPEDVG